MAQGGIQSSNRYTRERPCPVCGGHDQAERGRRIRCFGFITPDGKFAHCTREDYAGSLELNNRSSTYAHRLQGECPCGHRHGPDGGQANQSQEPEATYDYRDGNGDLLFQVVRMPGKKFLQRRPQSGGKWEWKLGNTKRVLYRLPELLAADPSHPVFIPEGEKDVDRLISMGLVATTNPGGALKWRETYNAALAGRTVVILPDNDAPDLKRMSDHYKGQRHAMMVAHSLNNTGRCAAIKVLELPNLPVKGDVSDWLDAGGTAQHLLALANACTVGPEYRVQMPEESNGHKPDSVQLLYDGSNWWEIARKIVEQGLLANGYFIRTEDREHYFFDSVEKRLLKIDKDSLDLRVLLNREFRINATDRLFTYLISEMEAECAFNGRECTVAQVAHYDGRSDVLYLDMAKGRMLRLDGQSIHVVDNGSDGVVFHSMGLSPWTFEDSAPEDLLVQQMVMPVKFASSGQTSFTPQEQRLLFTIWLLSLCFETEMPTKPVVLALGPHGSGKTFMLRSVGKLLSGDAFEVSSIGRDEEKDFWTTVTNSRYVVVDNADSYVRWFDDALAALATGVSKTRRKLFSDNTTVSYQSRVFIAVTARTPRFRRPDVAQRLLIFQLEPITEFESERELINRLMSQRDLLLSSYAKLLNKVVAANDVPLPDKSIRLADFAQVCGRVGLALDREEMVKVILDKLKMSQTIYGLEEHPIFVTLGSWVEQTGKDDGSMLDPEPNSTRVISTSQLNKELKLEAEAMGMRWRYETPVSLGINLKEIAASLAPWFTVEQTRTSKAKGWRISRTPEIGGDQP